MRPSGRLAALLARLSGRPDRAADIPPAPAPAPPAPAIAPLACDDTALLDAALEAETLVWVGRKGGASSRIPPGPRGFWTSV